MDIKIIAYMFNSINDWNQNTCDGICNNLIQEFSNLFNIKVVRKINVKNYFSDNFHYLADVAQLNIII